MYSDYALSPYRTAVDFSVSTDTIFFSDFTLSEKVIKELYKELAARLQFVGAGLVDEFL